MRRQASRAAARRRQYRPFYEDQPVVDATPDTPSKSELRALIEIERVDQIKTPRLRRMVHEGRVTARKALELEAVVRKEVQQERREKRWKAVKSLWLEAAVFSIFAVILWWRWS